VSTTGALLWLTWRQAVNRARTELRRLRQPRYLLGILAIAGYLWFFILSRMPQLEELEGLRTVGQERQAVWRVALKLFLLASGVAALSGAWLTRRARTALTLSEAEVTLLLGGPVSARQLLHLRLLRLLVRALLPAALWALLVGRGGGLDPIQVGAGLGLGAFLLGLHAAGAALVRARLAAAGWHPGLQRALPLLATGLLLLFAILELRAAGPLPGPKGVVAWWGRVEEGWLLELLLAPVWLPVELALSTERATTTWAALGCLALVAAHYVWLRALESTWLQAALPSGDGGGIERSARVRGRAAMTAWRLGARGAPALALVWKNLTAATRLQTGRFWAIGLLMGGAAALVLVGVPPEGRGAVLAMLCMTVAGFCALIGPGALRIDLRMELEGLDALRALPLRGWQLLGALMIAPAAALAMVEWALLLAALLLGRMAPAEWLPPQDAWTAWVVAAMAGLPVVTLAGLTVHNAVAVYFPAWSRVEEEKGRGFEAFGQRLLTLFGTLLALIGGGLPAGFLGLVVGVLLWQFGSGTALLAGALAATLTLLLEVLVVVWVLGRAFERLDPARELAP